MFTKTFGLKLLTAIGLFILIFVNLIGIFGRYYYIFDLFTHFHIQYAIGFGVLVGFFLYQKKPILIFIATCGLIIQVIFLLPYYFQPSVAAISQDLPITTRVFFNNINYGTSDFTPLIRAIHQNNPQLIGVVELSAEKYESLKTQLPEYPYSFHVSGRAKLGLALFSQLPLADDPNSIYFAGDRFPSIVATLQNTTSEKQLKVVVIHPPPPITTEFTSKRNELFDHLAEFAVNQTTPLLIMGDFNSTGWSPTFKKLLADSELIDSRDNQGVQPSWPSQLPKFLQIPIDHILTSQSLTILHREVLRPVGSDHLPIVADFSW